MSVRSSSTLEDLAEAAFAGQHDTFLSIVPADVPDRAGRGWLGAEDDLFFAPRAAVEAAVAAPDPGPAWAELRHVADEGRAAYLAARERSP